MKLNTKIFIVIIAVLIIAGFFQFILNPKSSSTKISKVSLDNFATCLKDRGAQFYGAFWCPHCQNQKKLFGRSADLLPYVECSMPDMKMNQLCKDMGIKGYPTWIFADQSRLSGEISLEILADKTSCRI